MQIARAKAIADFSPGAVQVSMLWRYRPIAHQTPLIGCKLLGSRYSIFRPRRSDVSFRRTYGPDARRLGAAANRDQSAAGNVMRMRLGQKLLDFLFRFGVVAFAKVMMAQFSGGV